MQIIVELNQEKSNLEDVLEEQNDILKNLTEESIDAKEEMEEAKTQAPELGESVNTSAGWRPIPRVEGPGVEGPLGGKVVSVKITHFLTDECVRSPGQPVVPKVRLLRDHVRHADFVRIMRNPLNLQLNVTVVSDHHDPLRYLL